MLPIFTADFGGNAWTVYDSQNDNYLELSSKDFLDGHWLRPQSLLVVEKAHLGTPRTKLSLAQPYTESELLSFYQLAKQKNVDVKLFPQGLTPKARARYVESKKKTDKEDCRALHAMVVNESYVKLMNPPKSFQPSSSREAGWQFKDDTNAILNVARRFDYKAPDDAISQFIEENIEAIAKRLSPTALEVFSMSEDDRLENGSFGQAKYKPRMSKLYTLAAMYLNPDGTFRVRADTGERPGIEWLKKHVIGNSPFHFKGGIARSNLHWHGFRNYAIARMGTRKKVETSNGKAKYQVVNYYDFDAQQNEEFRKHRREFFKAVSECLQVMRDLMV